MSNALDARPVITPDEATDRLGLNRLTIFALIDAGQLCAVNIGTGQRKHRRTSKVWLAEFLNGGSRDTKPVHPATAVI